MSDSTRQPARLVLTVVAVLAVCATAVLLAGVAVALSTGATTPWLGAAAVVLMLSLTWLVTKRKK